MSSPDMSVQSSTGVQIEYNGGYLLALTIAFFVLTTIILFLRFYSLYLKSCKPVWECTFTMLAYVCSVLFFVGIVILFNDAGIGHHVRDLQPHQIQLFSKLGWATAIVYTATVLFTRLSLLQFYRSIFENLHFKRVAEGMMVFSILWAFISWLIFIFQCGSDVTYFTKAIPLTRTHQCIDVRRYTLATGVINTLIYFIILVLPARCIYNIRKRREKLKVSILLLAGFFVCCASIVRLAYMGMYLKDVSDATWSSVKLYAWIVVELYLGIICASVPQCNHVFRTTLRRWRGMDSNGYTIESSQPTRGFTATVQTSFSVRSELAEKPVTISGDTVVGSDEDGRGMSIV